MATDGFSRSVFFFALCGVGRDACSLTEHTVGQRVSPRPTISMGDQLVMYSEMTRHVTSNIRSQMYGTKIQTVMKKCCMQNLQKMAKY